MRRKLFITGAVIAGLLVIAALWLLVLNREQDRSDQPLRGKADTVLKFKLTFREDSGKQDRQTLTLACLNGEPTTQSKGRNFDIDRQAKFACRSLSLLKPGDNTCGSISVKPGVYGIAEVKGMIKGKKFEARYENSAAKECIKTRLTWLQAEKIWTLQSKADPEAPQKSAKAKREQKLKTQKLKEEFQDMQRKHRESLENQRRQNQKYLAPDVEVTGDPANPR